MDLCRDESQTVYIDIRTDPPALAPFKAFCLKEKGHQDKDPEDLHQYSVWF